MREILFRGKDLYTKEWLYGLPFMDLDGTINGIETEPTCAGCRFIIPETLGQFTGMLDKNGKKIFEGDIVRARMDYGPAGFLDTIVDIGFKKITGYRWEYFDLDTIEIIGNVYDNPELLKGE